MLFVCRHSPVEFGSSGAASGQDVRAVPVEEVGALQGPRRRTPRLLPRLPAVPGPGTLVILSNMHPHVCTCMHMYAHACTCMHMHAHVCTCMHMYAHECTCMHIHAHCTPIELSINLMPSMVIAASSCLLWAINGVSSKIEHVAEISLWQGFSKK